MTNIEEPEPNNSPATEEDETLRDKIISNAVIGRLLLALRRLNFVFHWLLLIWVVLVWGVNLIVGIFGDGHLVESLSKVGKALVLEDGFAIFLVASSFSWIPFAYVFINWLFSGKLIWFPWKRRWKDD